MIKSQTIKFKVEDISSHLDGEDFTPTNFDEEIEGYIESIFNDKMVYMGHTFIPSGDYILAIITYRPMLPHEKEAADRASAANAGIVLAGDFKVQEN